MPSPVTGRGSGGPSDQGGTPSKDGRAARWAGQRERRRREFVEAALRVIAEQGPDVSTEQIAAEAGVARTQMYKHFADANDLRWAVAQRAKELLSNALGLWDLRGSPSQMIRDGIEAHILWLSQHRNLYRYLSRHSLVASSHERDSLGDLRTHISLQLTGLLEGYLRMLGVAAISAEPAAFAVVGLVDSATARWLDHSGGRSRAELADLLGRWVWGVLADLLRCGGVELDPEAPLTPPERDTGPPPHPGVAPRPGVAFGTPAGGGGGKPSSGRCPPPPDRR